MSDCKFKPGDVVQLKSGGALMTVAEAVSSLDGGLYRCTWDSGRGNIKSDHFPAAILKLNEGGEFQEPSSGIQIVPIR